MSSSRAVDGRFYASGHAYEDCFASEFEISPWWMLELDEPHTITRVYIVTCGKFVNRYTNLGRMDFPFKQLDESIFKVMACVWQFLVSLSTEYSVIELLDIIGMKFNFFGFYRCVNSGESLTN